LPLFSYRELYFLSKVRDYFEFVQEGINESKINLCKHIKEKYEIVGSNGKVYINSVVDQIKTRFSSG
jgi:hypothetical protein